LEQQKLAHQEEIEEIAKENRDKMQKQVVGFQSKAKKLAEMYDTRMNKAFEENKKKFEGQMKQIVEQVQGQCAEKLEDQVTSYREQIERCNAGVGSSDEKLRRATEDKLKCEKKLVEYGKESQQALLDMESKVITELSEQCEREKAEILAE